MGDWFDVTVAASRPSATGLWEVDLDVRGTPLAGAHQRAGQFLRLSVQGRGEGLFAIASAPGSDPGTLELLVKRGSPLSDALAELPPGAKVRVGHVEGRGFDVEQARGRDVLLFATGSGISALRSLLAVLLADRAAYGAITLYFGARTPHAFAYTAELDAWSAQDVQVLRTVSQPGDSGWVGLTGYVQEHVPTGDLSSAVAFLCGQPEMVQGVTEALTRRGMRREQISLNY